MKQLFIVLFTITLISCKPSQKTISDNYCPKDGNCSAMLLKNKAIKINTVTDTDRFITLESGDSLVFIFTYEISQKENSFDGNYIEEIYLQLDPNIVSEKFTNTDLQKIKATFNKQCFCKGESGITPIKNGTAYIKKSSENSYTIQLNFELDDGSNNIKKLNETLIVK